MAVVIWPTCGSTVHSLTRGLVSLRTQRSRSYPLNLLTCIICCCLVAVVILLIIMMIVSQLYSSLKLFLGYIINYHIIATVD